MMNTILTLWNYNFWAQEKFWESLADFSNEEFLRDLGEGNGSVRDKLAHIWGAEEVWRKRIRGEASPSFPDSNQFISVSSLQSEWSKTTEDYKNLLKDMTDEKLQSKIHYKNLKGVEFETPLFEILLHVSNHATYHRGQAASLIRRIKGKPPVTDLIEYFRSK